MKVVVVQGLATMTFWWLAGKQLDREQSDNPSSERALGMSDTVARSVVIIRLPKEFKLVIKSRVAEGRFPLSV